jgi:hypothetical protein
MANSRKKWMNKVRAALQSINMPFDDWQHVWHFDFQRFMQKHFACLLRLLLGTVIGSPTSIQAPDPNGAS